MSLFTEYEKIKALRETLPTIGSIWKVVESTRGTWGTNTPGAIVQIAKVDLTFVHYHYYGEENYSHCRDIETFKRTFRLVI